MTVKRIQLRGISRTPSDRMTSDGGCAESLNVHVDQDEIAPTPAPEKVNGMLDEQGRRMFPPDSYASAWHCIYIHAVQNVRRAILVSGLSIGYWNTGTQQITGVLTLQYQEEVVSVTHIGNTVVILTNQRTLYMLFKDDEYIGLGDRIPVPDVEFISQRVDYSRQVVLTEDQRTEEETRVFVDEAEDFNSNYDTLYGVTLSEEGAAFTAAVNSMSAKVWRYVNEYVNLRREEKQFARPVFVRYALRLYDGTYAYQSVPVLLQSGYDQGEGRDTFLALYSYVPAGLPPGPYINCSSPFTAERIVKGSFEGWEDIVRSVDIFLSTDVSTVDGGSEVRRLNFDPNRYIWQFRTERSIEDELLSKANYYLVESIELKDISADTANRKAIEPVKQDELVLKKTLPFDFRSNNSPSPLNDVTSYNERTLASGVRETLTRNFGHLQSTNYTIQADAPTPLSDHSDKFRFKYYVRGGDAQVYTVNGHDLFMDNQEFPSYYNDPQEGNTYEIRQMAPHGLLMYPDARCFQVDIDIISWSEVQEEYVHHIHRVPMKAHPNLDCAYAFGGSLTQTLRDFVEGFPGVEWQNGEKRELTSPNVLIQSQGANPFVYPASGWHTFTGSVMGAYMATIALSEGQFGQFPVYVFTADGIHVMSVGNNGELTTSHPVSRDVAVAGTICPIDQAIVFTTAKDVMMVTGSQIKGIGSAMDGRHYILETEARAKLNDTDWAAFADCAADTDSFITFMTQAKTVYDYTGNRLIAFNPAKRYHYVYQLAAGTWHKMTEGLATSTLFKNAIRSYPDALVCAAKDGETAILNFSTMKNIGGQQLVSRKGMIVTRPFDLEEPDIRKVIKDIRIRGLFNSGNVKYLLLGSMDGLHYGVLGTLRSGSYKLFRMVILTDLDPTERISWIDIDCDHRYVNKWKILL